MRTPDDPEANQPVFDVDPEFGKMAVQMGQGFKLPGVSLREKSLLCLANDVCEMNLDLAFQMRTLQDQQSSDDAVRDHSRDAREFVFLCWR
jgi:hypothetical protein